jgi:hypothetical protein
MTKHRGEFDWNFEFVNDPDSANLHLYLPRELLAEMDEARHSLPFHTREDFAVGAILWALKSVTNDETLMLMGLEDESRS